MADFLNAAKNGDVPTLKRQIEEQGKTILSYRGEGTADGVIGNTASHWAAAKGHSEALRFLLASGSDPHARNKGDSTPLHTAAMNGHIECARALLEARADPLIADEFGDTPLSLAAAKGHDALAELLRTGAPEQLDWEECKSKGNAAFQAKQYDSALTWYTRALQLVDEASATSDSLAALHSNRSACLAALRQFELAREAGERAVQLRPSWAKAHTRVAAALHGLGELELALEAYTKALQLEPSNDGAAAAKKNVSVALRNQRLEALIERGAFQKKGSAEGGEGEVVAEGGEEARKSSGAKEKTEEELEYARVVAEWKAAARTGQVAVLERLLASAPWLLHNRSERTLDAMLGNTALHWASANGRGEAVEWLLGCEGIERDARNHAGGTPLHSAAAHGRSAVVELLVEGGADTSLVDECGDTARDAASRRGYRSVEAIIDRGPLRRPQLRWTHRNPKPPSSDAAKQAGNAAFAADDTLSHRRAIWHYTDALLLDPSPDAAAVLFSNRSAAHAKCGQYHAALEDAERVVALLPQWGKGHGRRGAALQGLQEWKRAEEAFREGLRHEPASVQLQQGLEECLKQAAATPS